MFPLMFLRACFPTKYEGQGANCNETPLPSEDERMKAKKKERHVSNQPRLIWKSVLQVCQLIRSGVRQL